MIKHGNTELELISECCEAPAEFESVEGNYGWYVCTKCLQPCELIGFIDDEKEGLCTDLD